MNNINNTQVNFFNNLINLNNQENQENTYEELTNLSETIGDVSVGVKNKELFYEKKNDKKINCPICICETNEYVLTKCGHIFCEDCLKEWLETNNNCPLCNYEFIEK